MPYTSINGAAITRRLPPTVVLFSSFPRFSGSQFRRWGVVGAVSDGRRRTGTDGTRTSYGASHGGGKARYDGVRQLKSEIAYSCTGELHIDSVLSQFGKHGGLAKVSSCVAAGT